jgi:hypothetical protein
MKKIIIRVALVLVVLVIAAVVAITLSLDKIIKKAVETVGPQLTQVTIKLDGVSLSLLSGGGSIKGLHVGNPQGYKSPSAIDLGYASLHLKPSSLLSDKIVVRSIKVEAPEITFEGDLKGNNISKILENVEAATGGSGDTPTPQPEPAPGAGPGKKLQVDEFVITGGKIKLSTGLLAGKTVNVPLPNIRLTDLGTGPEGIGAGDLTKVVMKAINKETLAAVKDALAKVGTEAVGAVGDAAKDTEGAVKGVTDLFKKKK